MQRRIVMNKTELVSTNTPLEHERDLLLVTALENFSFLLLRPRSKRSEQDGKVFQRLRQTNDFLNCLERIDKTMGEKKQNAGRRYTVSSLSCMNVTKP